MLGLLGLLSLLFTHTPFCGFLRKNRINYNRLQNRWWFIGIDAVINFLVSLFSRAQMIRSEMVLHVPSDVLNISRFCIKRYLKPLHILNSKTHTQLKLVVGWFFTCFVYAYCRNWKFPKKFPALAYERWAECMSPN